jgi:hypothetical protein
MLILPKPTKFGFFTKKAVCEIQKDYSFVKEINKNQKVFNNLINECAMGGS